MKTRFYIRSRSGARDGFALVLVLGFLVLLTILLVSFIAFTRLNRTATASYSKSIQAQEIAQGGIQDILGDVRSEIIAGSTTHTVGTGPFATVYIPTTNLTAVPARLGYPAADWGTTVGTAATGSLTPALIRVSRADPAGGTAFYPTSNPLTSTILYPNMASVPGKAILNRASLANTSLPSFNGRSISATRWNKSYLLGFRTAAIPTIFSQATTPPSAPYGPPDWVYVTRTGSRVCTTSDVTNGYLSSTNSVTTTYPATTGNPPASPVVGRYAYIMYDEGALIDANAGGSTSSAIGEATVGTAPTYTGSPPTPPTYTDSTTGIISEVLGKSNVGHADLTQLTGAKFSQANIDAFLNWRSAGAISQVSTGGNAFLGAVFNNSQNKFLTFTHGDSPLLSRQDLVNYFLNLNSLNSSIVITEALPYLGTFSRALSAPSWFPAADSTAMPGYPSPLPNANWPTGVTYHTSMENTGVANRDMPNVRYPSAFTGVVHYNDAGTAVPYNVSAGDPLLQSRFSLSKIAWLSTADPVGGAGPTTYATAIQSCFGLTWGPVGGSANGGNPCWSYVGSPAGPGGSLKSFNGTIETLDQVAKEAREPNFFEVLKAAILSGSLGQNPGQAVFKNGTSLPFDLKNNSNNFGVDGKFAYSFDQSATIPAPCQIPDMQIMAIGANIIDQYGSSSYPTAIYFHYAYPGSATQLPSPWDAASTPATGTSLQYGTYGQTDMVFGAKNLPMLMGFYKLCCTIDGKPVGGSLAGDTGPTAGLSMWWQPVIWNPYAEPNPLNGGSLPPKTFMIQGYGQLNFEWGNPPPAYGGASQPQQMDGNQTISFTDSTPTTSAFYAHPQMLVLNDSAPGVPVPNVTVSASDMNDMAANFNMNGWTGTVTANNPGAPYGTTDAPRIVNPNHFVGFWCGNDPTWMGSTFDVNVNSSQAGVPASFALGWTSGNSFHPYCFLPGCISYIYGVLNNDSGYGDTPAGFTDPSQISCNWHLVMDVRTARFSGMSSYNLPAGPQESSTFFAGAGGGNTFYHSPGNGDGKIWTVPNPDPTTGGNPAFVWDNTTLTTKLYPHQDGYNEEDWEVNSPTPLFQASNEFPPTCKIYYGDPDGVVRPADGVYGNWTTGDGMPLFTIPGAPATASPVDSAMANGTQYPAGDNGGNVQHGRRPIILNRPFRSVGELGYTFRDLPFKTLDFFSAYSADAALLDVFSLTDEASISRSGQINSVVAGQIDLSNSPVGVIQALLSTGGKKDFDPNYYMSNGGPAETAATGSGSVALAIATQLQPSSAATGGGPLLNRANLATSLGTVIRSAMYNSSDKANKQYLEAPVRALADVTNTRTWNLLIDIIAQSGQMAPTAQSLNDFVVQGEKRYWLHIAIDRYTGKIIDQQLEQVYE